MGSGRKGLIRYDSPKIGPATIAASIAGNDFWDASISISGSAGETEYDFRVGYVGKTDETVETEEATEGTAAVPGETTETLVSGAELLGRLQMENPYVDDTAPSGDLYQSGGTPETDVDNVVAQPYIVSHIAAAEMGDDVEELEIVRVIGEADTGVIGNSVFRKRTTTPGMAAVDGTDAVTAVEESGDIIHVSGAVKFATGTSVNLAWAKEETGTKRQYMFGALAHNYGDGSIGIYLKRGSEGEGMAEVDSSVLGVGIGHGIGGGATVYAGYRVMKDDTPGTEDLKLAVAGIRVDFN
jgi:hypothetical protein